MKRATRSLDHRSYTNSTYGGQGASASAINFADNKLKEPLSELGSLQHSKKTAKSTWGTPI